MKAVNLIPSEYRQEGAGLANRSDGVAYIVLGLLAGVAVLAGVYGMARHQVVQKENEAAKLEAKAKTTQAQAARLTPYKTFISFREGRESAIASLVNSRFDWAHTMRDLGRVLPSGVSINNIQGAIGSSSASASAPSGGAVASATPAGSVPSLTLSGCATSQSTVAILLSRLRLMDGVSNVELHQSTRGGSSSGGGTAGGCPAKAPTFAVAVAFEPLPAPPSGTVASGSSSKSTVSATSGSRRPE